MGLLCRRRLGKGPGAEVAQLQIQGLNSPCSADGAELVCELPELGGEVGLEDPISGDGRLLRRPERDGVGAGCGACTQTGDLLQGAQAMGEQAQPVEL